MEISKKQFVLYTVILLIVAGGTTVALAPPPEDLMPLWDRIWQVAQPVSVDDNMGSLTVDTDSGALDVVGTMTVDDGDGSLTVDGTVNVGSPVTIGGTVTLADGTVVKLEEPVTVQGTVDVGSIAEPVTVQGTVDIETPITVAPKGKSMRIFYGDYGYEEDSVTVDVSGFKRVFVYVSGQTEYAELEYLWWLNFEDGTSNHKDFVALPHDQSFQCVEIDVRGDAMEFRLDSRPPQGSTNHVIVELYLSPY